MPAIIVITTTPNLEPAQSVAKLLVRQKLAACVSVLDRAYSYYRWKGKITRAREALILIKTTKKNFAQVEQALKRTHPYEVPEIIAVPIVLGSKKYLSWLESSVRH